MEFAPCPDHSIGVELELQLLDATTLDLHPGIMSLLDFYPHSERVKPELIQSCVELNSGKCSNIAAVRAGLFETARNVLGRTRNLGMRICSAGLHPFSRRLALITPLPRYEHIERSQGYLAHTQLTYGAHVHIGMRSGDEAVAVMSRLTPCLPVLIAMTANSACWRGYDTGHADYRHRILATTADFGIPPYFQDWEDFCRFFAIGKRGEAFRTFKDIHWDVRLHPDFGTVEIRVMDAQPTISHTVAVAALIHGLASYLAGLGDREPDPRIPRRLSPWMEKENHFRASCKGLDAEVFVNDEGYTRPVRGMAVDLLEAVRPVAEGAGEGIALDALGMMLEEGVPYQVQRRIRQARGSCHAVVEYQTKQFEADLREAIAAA